MGVRDAGAAGIQGDVIVPQRSEIVRKEERRGQIVDDDGLNGNLSLFCKDIRKLETNLRLVLLVALQKRIPEVGPFVFAVDGEPLWEKGNFSRHARVARFHEGSHMSLLVVSVSAHVKDVESGLHVPKREVSRRVGAQAVAEGTVNRSGTIQRFP